MGKKEVIDELISKFRDPLCNLILFLLALLLEGGQILKDMCKAWKSSGTVAGDIEFVVRKYLSMLSSPWSEIHVDARAGVLCLYSMSSYWQMEETARTDIEVECFRKD